MPRLSAWNPASVTNWNLSIVSSPRWRFQLMDGERRPGLASAVENHAPAVSELPDEHSHKCERSGRHDSGEFSPNGDTYLQFVELKYGGV